jgi:hypothetical protein
VTRKADIYPGMTPKQKSAALFTARNGLKLRILKAITGCRDCGITDHRILEFAHRDPDTKSATVTSMYSHTDERVAEEISKCDVLCANHHILNDRALVSA